MISYYSNNCEIYSFISTYLSIFLVKSQFFYGASKVVLVVKNLSANAGDMRDVGWIPEVGRSRSRAWQPTPVFLKTPMDREPSGLQSVGSHRVGHN